MDKFATISQSITNVRGTLRDLRRLEDLLDRFNTPPYNKTPIISDATRKIADEIHDIAYAVAMVNV
jgi:hypothetical protein